MNKANNQYEDSSIFNSSILPELRNLMVINDMYDIPDFENVIEDLEITYSTKLTDIH